MHDSSGGVENILRYSLFFRACGATIQSELKFSNPARNKRGTRSASACCCAETVSASSRSQLERCGSSCLLGSSTTRGRGKSFFQATYPTFSTGFFRDYRQLSGNSA